MGSRLPFLSGLPHIPKSSMGFRPFKSTARLQHALMPIESSSSPPSVCVSQNICDERNKNIPDVLHCLKLDHDCLGHVVVQQLQHLHTKERQLPEFDGVHSSTMQRRSSLFDRSSHIWKCILWLWVMVFAPLPVVQLCSTFMVQTSSMRKEGRRGTFALQRVTAAREADMVSCSIWEISLPFLISLLWDWSVELVWNFVCVWNDHCKKSMCAFCHFEFRVKCTQAKIMIVLLLQLSRCAVGPNTSSHLSVAHWHAITTQPLVEHSSLGLAVAHELGNIKSRLCQFGQSQKGYRIQRKWQHESTDFDHWEVEFGSMTSTPNNSKVAKWDAESFSISLWMN